MDENSWVAHLPEKTCTNCNSTYPLIDSYFARDADSPDDFKNQCKTCDEVIKQFKVAEEVKQRVADLDQRSLSLLDQISDEPSVINLPHVATLLEDLVTVWGGSLGFAQRCQAEYLAAKPGSMIRQRYNTLISKLVLEASDKGYVQMPLDKLTDDELEQAYIKRKEALKLRLIHDQQDIPDAG